MGSDRNTWTDDMGSVLSIIAWKSWPWFGSVHSWIYFWVILQYNQFNDTTVHDHEDNVIDIASINNWWFIHDFTNENFSVQPLL